MKRKFSSSNCVVVAACLGVVGLAGQPANAVTFTEGLVSGSYGYAYGLAAADVTGDNKVDLVSANATAGDLYYYTYNGTKFTKKTIENNASGIIERMAVGYVNNDSRRDVVIVNNQVGWPNPPDPNHGEIYWYENPASGPNWTQHSISTNFPHAYDVALADLNNDGKLDVAASSYIGGTIAWFENPGTTGLWEQHTLATGLGDTRTARIADFNGDGRPDILATTRTQNLVIWYENNGNETFTSHTIDNNLIGAAHAEPVDIDGDGDMDIVAGAGFLFNAQDGQVVWYENNGNGTFTKFLVAALPYAIDVAVGDLDNDGDMDIAATAFATSGVAGNHVVWYENTPGGWVTHVLKTNWYGANSIILTDMNQDGWLDIFSSAEQGVNEVRWWKNNH